MKEIMVIKLQDLVLLWHFFNTIDRSLQGGSKGNEGDNGDKAPGSGFTMAFFQHYWQVLAGNIMTPFFKEFHDSYQFEKSLHASFITLIPKK